MVRIKRGSGKKDEEGVCGIAKSPSIALGGVLLSASGVATTDVLSEIDNSWKQTQRLETTLVYSRCESIGLGHARLCNRIERWVVSGFRRIIHVSTRIHYALIHVYMIPPQQRL